MVAELMFTVDKVWYDKGMICMILSDKKEVRFPIYLNGKLRNASESEISKLFVEGLV